MSARRKWGVSGDAYLAVFGSAWKRVPTTDRLRPSRGNYLWTPIIMLSIAPYRRGGIVESGARQAGLVLVVSEVRARGYDAGRVGEGRTRE